MTGMQEWRCKSCRTQLGQVHDGTLLPTVPVESVDYRGVTRVPCPRCQRVKVWFPGRPAVAPNLTMLRH